MRNLFGPLLTLQISGDPIDVSGTVTCAVTVSQKAVKIRSEIFFKQFLTPVIFMKGKAYNSLRLFGAFNQNFKKRIIIQKIYLSIILLMFRSISRHFK